MHPDVRLSTWSHLSAEAGQENFLKLKCYSPANMPSTPGAAVTEFKCRFLAARCHPCGAPRLDTFAHDQRVTQTWRGRPLVDRIAVVELIAAATTKAGLKVASALDTTNYQKGMKVS